MKIYFLLQLNKLKIKNNIKYEKSSKWEINRDISIKI